MTQKRMKSVRGTLSNLEVKKKISDANTNQISGSKKFNLSRCQQKKKKKSNANTKKANRISDSKTFKQPLKKKKKKSVHSCKEKSIVEMDIVAHSQGAIISQQDVMREILSWLPVRSLLRFKCVAKSWDVTSDPYFRMKHQSLNSLRFLLSTNAVANLYSTSSLSSPDDVQTIDHLSSNNNPSLRLLCGSCDGLVLIRVATTSTHELLLLLNPSTRESIQLPFPMFGMMNSTFGLGYDPTTHDYKILTIHTNKSQAQCAILALRSGSWRNVDIEEPHIFRNKRNRYGFADPLAFVHGAFHWIPYHFLVVSFNISNEVYTKIPFSDQMYSYLSLSTPGGYHVSVLEGMLCFTSTCPVQYDVSTFTLWVMKDYGVKESWAQLLKIKVGATCVAKPIYRFADGDILFHCRGQVLDSFRTSKDSFRTFKGRFRLWSDSLVQHGAMIEVVTFNESLISPKSLI